MDPLPSSTIAKAAARELNRVLADSLFKKSKVLQRLLSVLVDRALKNLPVTESFLAQELLGLSEKDFHPYSNPYIRVNTSLLRKRLRQYYARTTPEQVMFHLPTGSFMLRVDAVRAADAQWKRVYSQARLLGESRYIEEVYESIALCESVLQQKPDFAPAWALIANSHITIASHGGPPEKHMAIARVAAEKSMECAPDSWEAQTAYASMLGLGERKWGAAEEIFQRALLTSRKQVIQNPWFQAHLVATGRLAELLTIMEQALPDYEVPPRVLQQNYAIGLHLASRFEEAEAELTRTALLYADDYSVWIWLGMQHWLQGRNAKALEALGHAVLVSRNRIAGDLIASATTVLKGALQPRRQTSQGSSAEMATLFANSVLGRDQAALEAMQRMIEARNPIAYIVMRSPIVRRLSHLPGYEGMYRAIGSYPQEGDS